jgi:D-methionine transport system permease protein
MSGWELVVKLLPTALLQTLYMVSLSGVLAAFFGAVLGVILFCTQSPLFYPSRCLHNTLSFLVNIGRSIPFAILIVAIIPFTRWLVGTSIGTTASIVPLTLAATPFFARLVQASLLQIDPALIKAAYVMGSSARQILFKVLLKEARPSLIRALTVTWVTLVSYSALAGLVGGGGLGKLAIQYGYQRFDAIVMGVTLVLLLALVEAIEFTGQGWAKYVSQKRGLE